MYEMNLKARKNKELTSVPGHSKLCSRVGGARGGIEPERVETVFKVRKHLE